MFGLLAVFLLLSHYLGIPVFDEFYTASVVSLIVYGYSFFVLILVYRFPVVSFPVLFLLVYGLFHLSTMILTVFDSFEVAVSTYDYLDIPSLKVASVVVILTLSAFMLGVGVANQRSTFWIQATTEKKTRRKDYTQAIHFIAYGLFGLAASIIVVVSLSGEGLSISVNQSYRAFIEWRSQDKLIITLFMASLNWLLPWSILMLFGCAENTRQLLRFSIFAGFGVILMVLSGDRTAPLIIFILFFVRMYLFRVNISFIKLLPVMTLVVLLIPILSILRHEGFGTWNSQSLTDAIFLEAGESFRVGMNPVTATLIETGAGFQNLMGTVLVVPKNEDYRYGIDYLKSLVVGVPFSAKILGISVPDNSGWIKSWLFPLRMAGPGFSISAETYLQFGNIGVLVIFFGLGYIITYGWFYLCANSDNKQIVMYLLILMQVILIWVRNEFTATIRPAAWCWILIFIIIPILQKILFNPRRRHN